MRRRYPTALIEIVVVGGAAMVGRIESRYTLDVDVISEGMTKEFREVARIVAERHNLRPDWINDAAKLKTVAVPTNLETLYVGTHLNVYSAGARYVLAMKLVSSREFDLPDCVHLIRELEIETRKPDDLLNLIEEALPYPDTRTAKMEYFALDAFKEARKGRTARLIRRKVNDVLSKRPREQLDHGAEVE